MGLNLTILGSGAATPTLKRGVTSQFLNINERKILIDCGEGTQLQLRKFQISFQRLNFIFISHLHGDHYLGLVGLLSSMHLLGRTAPIHLYAPPTLKDLLDVQFKLTEVYLNFELIFHPLEMNHNELVFEDNSIEIFAFPLKHRISCYGFLFKEKIKERSLIKSKIEEFDLKIPEIVQLKQSKNVLRESGETLFYENLTTEPPKPISYAFCTDTKYLPHLSDILANTDILYHEATFTDKYKNRAKATFHATAKQAATLAKNAQVGQLLLGHFSARYKSTKEIEEEAKSIFESVVCVNDGDNFILNR